MYNKMPGGREPDWSLFDLAEAWPFVMEYMEDGSTHIYDCRAGAADGWMVSARRKVGGWVLVDECKTETRARVLAADFNRRMAAT